MAHDSRRLERTLIRTIDKGWELLDRLEAASIRLAEDPNSTEAKRKEAEAAARHRERDRADLAMIRTWMEYGDPVDDGMDNF